MNVKSSFKKRPWCKITNFFQNWLLAPDCSSMQWGREEKNGNLWWEEIRGEDRWTVGFLPFGFWFLTLRTTKNKYSNQKSATCSPIDQTWRSLMANRMMVAGCMTISNAMGAMWVGLRNGGYVSLWRSRKATAGSDNDWKMNGRRLLFCLCALFCYRLFILSCFVFSILPRRFSPSIEPGIPVCWEFNWGVKTNRWALGLVGPCWASVSVEWVMDRRWEHGWINGY